MEESELERQIKEILASDLPADQKGLKVLDLMNRQIPKKKKVEFGNLHHTKKGAK